jgi:hypothetical protein
MIPSVLLVGTSEPWLVRFADIRPKAGSTFFVIFLIIFWIRFLETFESTFAPILGSPFGTRWA